MCSIAGLVWEAPTQSGPEGRNHTLEMVRAMNRALSHRGPDGEGVTVIHDRTQVVHRWTGRGEVAAAPWSRPVESRTTVGLGMNRLAIRDVEHGHQPMLDASGRATIVFNGEIYNTAEIAADLRSAGVTLRTRSDTEVIIEAYMRWGEACVDRLAGMFAFAIWDDRDESLFVARDRLGIKPLVWARGGGALLFGSELKGVLAANVIERRVRVEALNRYLFHYYVPPPEGPLEDLFLLEPGHTLTWREGKIAVRRYWAPSFAPAERQPLSAHVERFRSYFEEAVRSHLVSDVPIGAFLSGGLDSTSIVALMKKHSPTDVHTFTVGFDVSAYDESKDAQISASFLDTDHHEVQVGLADIEDLIVRVLSHYDQPFADSSAVPTYVLCRETARHVKVALAGDGSDEQLAGYPRVKEYAVFEALRHVPPVAQALSWVADRAAPVLGARARRARNFADYAEVLKHGGAADPMSGYIHLRNTFRDGWYERIVTPEFAERVRGDDPSFHVHDAARNSKAPDPLSKMLEVEVLTYLPNDILQKVDMASGAHGLEVRVPFLDHRLVEAISAMPLSAKLRPGETKVALRRALGPLLPPNALKRKKKGFHLPLAEWLRERGRPLVSDMLLGKRARERGYFRYDAIERMANEHLERRADHCRMLFVLLQLELWHRTWVDRAAA